MLRIIARALICIMFFEDVAFAAARTASTTNVLSTGTTIATQGANTLVPAECENQFFGCMDNFCLVDNETGGRCICSADAEKYAAETAQLRGEMARLETNTVTALNRIETGLGMGTSNTSSNASAAQKQKPAVKLLSLYDMDDEDEEESDDIIVNKQGVARYAAALEFCHERMGDECRTSSEMLDGLYARTLKSDCTAWANAIKEMRTNLSNARVVAKSEIQQAGLESYRAANKYDLGECIIAYRDCYIGADVCGDEWGDCAGMNDAETEERLMAKQPMCDRVLDQCVAVRDQVWDGFRALVKTDLLLAQRRKESDLRHSCLTTVTQCIKKACRDDIAGTGQATEDSCLAYPQMARSFCQVEIDRCEPYVPNLWEFEVIELAAQRVEGCKNEVQNCFASENACGPDMLNCLGLDYAALHLICPPEKLVVCKAGNPDFSFDDLDQVITSIYNNIDNKFSEECDLVTEEKMLELCGDTTTCPVFANQAYIGANSLAYQQRGDRHIVSGLINFGLLEVSKGEKYNECIRTRGENCDQYPRPGTLNVDEYLEIVRNNTQSVSGVNTDATIDKIEQELRGIQAQIDAVSNLLLADPKVDVCINGRDLKNVTGRDEKTSGRYPSVADAYLLAIAEAARLQASANYTARFTQLEQEALANKEADEVEYSCYQLPLLLEGQIDSSDMQTGGKVAGTNHVPIARVIDRAVSRDDLLELGGRKTEIKIDDMITRTVAATWNANTRVCHITGTDKYCGKESLVNKRMQMNEKSYDPDTKNAVLTNSAIAAGAAVAGTAAAGVAIGLATTVTATTGVTLGTGIAAQTATLFTVGATAGAVPVVGWAVAAAVVLTALGTMLFGKKDPYICREKDWERDVNL